MVKQTHFKSNSKLSEASKNLEFIDKNDEVDIPNTVETMGVKNANQFYRAKIKSLQIENVRLQMELKKKVSE